MVLKLRKNKFHHVKNKLNVTFHYLLRNEIVMDSVRKKCHFSPTRTPIKLHSHKHE